jgi:exonuclease SbcD
VPLRILHTSDWHLGHVLHDHDRSGEHAAFLSFLRAQLVAHEVDALLVAGDIFDTANPTAEAQALFYDFVAAARREHPELQIVVIAGNHDSAARLDAPGPLFRALNVRVVGGLPQGNLDGLIVPLVAQGSVRAQVAAVPFLRPADLPQLPETPGVSRLIEGVRAVYGNVLDLARSRRGPGQSLLAMGHCYLAQTQLSEKSERRILGGNQHALPADIFPADCAYVALGHLHRAQRVAGRNVLRYSGSPIPLSLDERTYRHGVILAELDGEGEARITELPVPRVAEVLRIPERGAASPEAVLELCAQLPRAERDQPEHTRPFLVVVVALQRPEPGLRAKLFEALHGKAARLASVRAVSLGDGLALADRHRGRSVQELEPETVFRDRFAQDFPGAPDDALLQAFATAVDDARAERSPA